MSEKTKLIDTEIAISIPLPFPVYLDTTLKTLADEKITEEMLRCLMVGDTGLRINRITGEKEVVKNPQKHEFDDEDDPDIEWLPGAVAIKDLLFANRLYVPEPITEISIPWELIIGRPHISYNRLQRPKEDADSEKNKSLMEMVN